VVPANGSKVLSNLEPCKRTAKSQRDRAGSSLGSAAIVETAAAVVARILLWMQPTYTLIEVAELCQEDVALGSRIDLILDTNNGQLESEQQWPLSKHKLDIG
jgi:hypothetical protein